MHKSFEKGKKYTFYAGVVPGGGELPAAATVVASGASNTAYEKPDEVAAALFLTYTLGDTITITGFPAPQVGQTLDQWDASITTPPTISPAFTTT